MIHTSGVDHITLIVKDVNMENSADSKNSPDRGFGTKSNKTNQNLCKSKEFYQNLCGMKIVADYGEACGLSDGTFSLWVAQSKEPSSSGSFNSESIGLNHWAFKITSMAELKNIEKTLKDLKVPMEDEGITDDGYGGTGIFTQDPDNMKVEFHLRE